MIIKGKEMVYRLEANIYHCALDISMRYIGGKWKSVILWYLREESKRYSEIKKLIPDISDKMLSLQLKQLESDNIIQKVGIDKSRIKVAYELTREGQTLNPVLEELARWGRAKASKSGKLVEFNRK